ncbi:MAG TPA: glycine oxidase ThiO [Streptosporangiaceae bacterium]|jgi:glycine oxidase|nr:glycine oxidase ThiO [Streptosporangiaceae bacterium]
MNVPAGSPTADVLVIGGGVVGLAIAWRAAQRGLRVTLADPSPGQGATHVAAGMLTPLAEASYAERELFRLGIESLRRYPGFAAELTELTGLPTGLRQTGTLQVAYDGDDLAVLEEARQLQESFGWPARRLTARECRQAEPMLDPAVRGGLLAEDDGSVDPRLLAAALLSAGRLAGVRLIREPAAEILTAGEAVTGARLADGSVLSAPRVVVAAGWQSAALAGLGQALPLRPVKGQILRLRPARRPASMPPSVLGRTVRGLIRGSSVYLVPRADGELVVGATQEELGPDTTVTAGGVWELLRDARLLIPGITEFELAQAQAGLRPGTPDNAPAIGPGAQPGLVLATGHFRGGVLLAPVTADMVADYLVSGHLPELAAPFAPARFWPGSAGPGPATTRPAGQRA